MNIEIANRLVNLRKSNNLSQEALAEKLGISRQAVSKWERAEASPDTDNLILLARLYHISLDELLKTEDEIPVPENEEPVPENEEPVPEFGDAFLEVDPAGQETEWDWDNVQIDENGDYVNGEKNEGVWSLLYSFPMPILIIIVYLIIGFKFGAWHPGWLLFL
ncbi:MAG: helix-turn-helix transcriptional regulator, partial [Lachnospiraceae bacterium]|nr:helix-turn-helix transcriptional regulator [Lachnospiraceae bacterium]